MSTFQVHQATALVRLGRVEEALKLEEELLGLGAAEGMDSSVHSGCVAFRSVLFDLARWQMAGIQRSMFLGSISRSAQEGRSMIDSGADN